MSGNDQKAAIEAELLTYVGKLNGPPIIGRDVVNEPMIRQWCDAMGERHPAYLDSAAAAKTVHGEIVAPPTMLQAWVLDGWSMHEGYDEPTNEQQRLHSYLASQGYTGVLGTNAEETYSRYLRLGDRVTSQLTIESISPEKATGVGLGFFITTRTTFENQAGEDLGSLVFRVLRFKPTAQPNADAASGEKSGAGVAVKPSRIKPTMGHDNAWWWARVAEDDVIPIQRCKQCRTLRHPPRPMCDQCACVDFDSIDAAGQATIHTFTVIHYPQVPGYEYPIIAIIVDLPEGVRMASTLVDCRPDDVSIGMTVTALIHEDGDGFKIPFFRPA